MDAVNIIIAVIGVVGVLLVFLGPKIRDFLAEFSDDQFGERFGFELEDGESVQLRKMDGSTELFFARKGLEVAYKALYLDSDMEQKGKITASAGTFADAEHGFYQGILLEHDGINGITVWFSGEWDIVSDPYVVTAAA